MQLALGYCVVLKIAMDSQEISAVEPMGYMAIKDKQMKAVVPFAKGRDLFISLPTSSGSPFVTRLTTSKFN